MSNTMVDEQIRKAISNVLNAFPDDWVWYCSVHEVGGSANSTKEVSAVANAHQRFIYDNEFEDDSDYCDVVTALIPARDVYVTESYPDPKQCACGLQNHDDYRVHLTEDGVIASV